MKRFFCVVLALAAASLNASAQDFRGGITGRILDASERPDAGRHRDSHQRRDQRRVVHDDQRRRGLLDPLPEPRHLHRDRGAVRLQESARAPNIEVRIGEKLDVDLTLDVGADGGNGLGHRRVAAARDHDRDPTGQVIGEKTIAMMPLSDGNPFALARLAPGIAYIGDLKFSRPFDNGGTSDIVTGGAHRRQRVHARRLAEHGQRPPRGVRAAGGRRAGVQGRDRELRRGQRPHRRRDRST